jgi:hypothetical protein
MNHNRQYHNSGGKSKSLPKIRITAQMKSFPKTLCLGVLVVKS